MAHVIGIVEDDPDQLVNYADALRKKGYSVISCASKAEALDSFAKTPPDLVILDIILGADVDGGFDICRELLQENRALPVVFLTDRVDEVDRISGLRMGAWDYETKPISLTFLAEKVAALLRIRDLQNKGDHPSVSTMTRGFLILDEERMKVTWKEIVINLTLTEFRMLAALARRPGRVLTYEGLMESALQSVVAHNTINTHIRNIRGKFVTADLKFNCIENEYALGYRWKCDLS